MLSFNDRLCRRAGYPYGEGQPRLHTHAGDPMATVRPVKGCSHGGKQLVPHWKIIALGRILLAWRTLSGREPLVELDGRSEVAACGWRIE